MVLLLLFVYYLASCSMWDLSLWHTSYLIVAGGLSCPAACEILVPRPGMEPMSHVLTGRFLTTGPSEKSPKRCLTSLVFLCTHSLSHVWLCDPMDYLSMEFFRQEYWSRLPFPPPGDLPDPGIEPGSPESPSLASEFFTTEPLGSPTYHMPPSKYIRNTYTERKDKSDIWEWKTSIAESNTTSTCLSLVSSTTIYLTSLLLPYLPSWIFSNKSNTVYFRALIIHLL